jgi:Protein of unknown function (DUF3180)
VRDENRLQFTRLRDLAVVFVVLGGLVYLFVRWNYASLPTVPRLAGVSAALLGIGEAAAGFVIRARLKVGRGGRPSGMPASSADLRWGEPKPLPPLVGARALMVAKASSLAGAGLAGIWVGLLAYVLPLAEGVRAAGSDTTSAIIGASSAVIMTGGALWLERCCVAPRENDRGH